MPNDYINQITDTGGTTYDIRDTVKQGTIFQGAVDGTSTSTVFTATIDGITEYHDGLAVMLKNGVVTSASGFTININGLGAKPVYNSMAAASAETTIFNINYTLLLVYDSTRVAGGCWLNYRGYNSDTNTIAYQIRTNSSNLPTASALYRYRLLFTSADRTKWIPVNTTNSTSATSKKTMNTLAIDPFGDIAYYGSTSVLSANANVGATTLWRQYVINLGYSFNTTGSALVMTYPAPVFVKCTPQSDGSAKIDGYVQALPNTADGKIYIYLGTAYSETNIELVPQHPVYYYTGGAIRLWTGKADFSGSYTDLTDKPTIPSSAADVGAVPTTRTVNGKALSSDISLTASDVGALASESDPVFTSSAAYGISSSDISTWNGKQNALVSGTNIKTINSESILGSGDITISGGGSISAMKRIGASSGTLTLSTSYQTIKMSQTSFTEGSDFEASTNGIKCKKAGLIHISAKVRLADGFTANDYVNCRAYNNTTSTAIGSGRIRMPFQAYNGDVVIDCYAVVSANDDIYLQAQNETGSRGKVTYSVTVLSIAYVNTGSGGGGGVTDVRINNSSIVSGGVADFGAYELGNLDFSSIAIGDFLDHITSIYQSSVVGGDVQAVCDNIIQSEELIGMDIIDLLIIALHDVYNLIEMLQP